MARGHGALGKLYGDETKDTQQGQDNNKNKSVAIHVFIVFEKNAHLMLSLAFQEIDHQNH